MSAIDDSKEKLPLPLLMQQLGLGDHARKSARCPFHEDRHNSFSVWQRRDGSWQFKCHAGCGKGDEINLVELHERLSRSDATKRFLEMAGVAQMRRALSAQKSNSENRTPVDWQRCFDAFSAKHVERLGEWRGYSGEFCSWLHKSGLVGLWRKRVGGVWQDHIAFPVHDRAGKVVAVHYWQKEDASWRYYPSGAKVHLLVIGELTAGEAVHAFESQWDAFAFMDVSGERSGIIITRGASNGAVVGGVIPENSTVYLWTQNDSAGEKWQRDICANTKAAVKRPKILAPHKDLNDWTRAGATAGDLLTAMRSVQAIREPEDHLSSVLDSICDFLQRYVRFSSPAQPTAIALWVAHTWALDAFDYTPYLHIFSPEKRCGKTRLLDCIELIAAKPWRAISPTEAVLFRKIEADRPTLLLDEVDAVFSGSKDERKEPLRALLNAGFERKAKIPRCVGPNFQVQDFEVFCAKAFAGIGRLPDTVNDRCIPVRLVRRSREESLERFRKREAEAAVTSIRAQLAEWAGRQDASQKLHTARPEVPTELSDRQADICEPLLAIADLAGGEWLEGSRKALVSLCATENEDDSLGIKLLLAVREVFEWDSADRISTANLLEELVHQETDAPWPGWWEQDLKNGNTKGPGARLARLLKPFGIKARVIRLPDDSTPRGYMREDFKEVWKRYCPPDRQKDATMQQTVALYL